VVHTPGHAANHLCLLLRRRPAVLGDHILNGSTTVIDPPDGNMADYLDSLDRWMRCAPNMTWTSSCPPTAMCWARRAPPSPA
jgi:glyoxylase-like metal-dependent hydrolase (beta-lactamase superfamily II)